MIVLAHQALAFFVRNTNISCTYMLVQAHVPRAPASTLPAVLRGPAHASLLPQAATRTSTHKPPSSRHAHQHTQASLKPPRALAHASLLPQAASCTSTREPSPSSRLAHHHTRAFSFKPQRAPAHTFPLLLFSPRTPQQAPLFLIANINFNYTLCAAMTHALY